MIHVVTPITSMKVGFSHCVTFPLQRTTVKTKLKTLPLIMVFRRNVCVEDDR